jgi:hypothetical protein
MRTPMIRILVRHQDVRDATPLVPGSGMGQENYLY